jgi:UDP-glucose 4-epimerase
MNTLRTCVVTGGAGAIGSQLVRALLARGVERVVVVDDLSSGFHWLLPEDPRIEFVYYDLRKGGAYSYPMGTATVFHLAAFFANQNSVDNPVSDLMTNGLGTLNVLDLAHERQARRVIYTSAGCSIAGHGVEGPIHEGLPPSLHLDTPYQITKALGEYYANYYSSRGLPTVRARLFNSYGPGEVPGKYRNVVPNFIWAAMHGKPLIITGDGSESRDFVFVEDVVRGLILLAEHPDAEGEAVNLGGGTSFTIRTLARQILDLTGSKSEIQFAPRRDWDKHTSRTASITKAQGLGWEAQTILQDGLKKTINWFLHDYDNIERSLR